jgi:hypothetical protein
LAQNFKNSPQLDRASSGGKNIMVNKSQQQKSKWDGSCPACGEKESLLPLKEITFTFGYSDGEQQTTTLPFSGLACISCGKKFIDFAAHENIVSDLLSYQEAENEKAIRDKKH